VRERERERESTGDKLRGRREGGKETENSYVAQAGLELEIFLHSLLSAGITGMSHHTLPELSQF
jgi:hypothetical protein